MGISARSVRVALVATGLLLVAALTAVVLRSRARLDAAVKGIPRRFGVDISQESDNFTYSQSLKGRTIYTIHASKELQHKDGRITLKNVGIVLYGNKGERADQIHGDEFEYDQRGGMLRAVGTVYLDLAAPDKRTVAGQPTEGARDSRLIHIKTSGLTFVQKTEFATTKEAVEFRVGEVTGNSVGASYDSARDLVVLESAVRIAGLKAGSPVHLTASHAVLDQSTHIATLQSAAYVAATAGGSESAAAEHTVVHLEEDGTPRSVSATGHVTLRGGGRGVVTGDRLEMVLNEAGQPVQGDLFEHVLFRNDDPRHLGAGRADEAHVLFDPAGNPRNVLLAGAVDLNQKAGPSERRLHATKVDLTLSGGGKRPLVVRAGEASGAAGGDSRAWLHLVDQNTRGRDGHGTLTTDIRADVLTGRFAAQSRSTELDGLDGRSHTQVERVERDAHGITETEDTSNGDLLKLALHSDGQGRMQLASAEQHGSVQIVRTSAARQATTQKPDARPAAARIEHARANNDFYDVETDVATLTGSVALADSDSALFADRVELDHRAGISTATGAVRVSYVDAGSPAADPIHVIAGRAVFTQATGMALFTDVGRARMWQASSQVEAPVLELNRSDKTLLAHGSSGEAGAVRTVLANTAGTHSGTAAKPHSSTQTTGPVHVLSDRLSYADQTRQVIFRGRVRMEDNEGLLSADEATAYLEPAAAKSSPAFSVSAVALPAGRLERFVGTGHVILRQPGRTGSGERILYTAADQTYVLTGSRSTPPKVVDDVRGQVSGAVLRFRSDDQTVFVEGDADRQRVSTETKIKQ